MNAPARMQKAMTHVESDALVAFAEIYEPHVEMVSVTAPPTAAVADAVQLLLQEASLQAQWVQGDGEVNLPSGRSRSISNALAVLREDIELPVELLKELFACSACGVRLKVLKGAMCPRFHVDRVPCRMLRTYAGSGTEWIAHNHINPKRFAARDEIPLAPGGQVQQLPTGMWSLLKGGLWDGDFPGVVHRSPSSSTARLLVTLDPIFGEDS